VVYRRDVLPLRARRRLSTNPLVRGVAVLLALLAHPPLAHAQTPSEIATARAWFADGLAHEEAGDFTAALSLFRRAAQVKRTPQIAYHVAFCESRTGALVLALVDLESAATVARAAHAEDVAIAVEAELADVRRRIPTLEVHDASDGKATRLLVDGNAVSLAMVGTPMPLDPGEHTVTLELASGAKATKTVTLAERDKKTADLSPSGGAAPVVAPLPPPPVAVPTPPPSNPSSAAPAPSSGRTLPWVTIGIGGALLAGGVGLFADAWIQEGNLHSKCPSMTNCPSNLQGTYSTAKTFDALGIGLGVAGVAVAGLGVSLLVFHPSPSTTAHLDVSPHGASLTARF
jgi:hypothetical protein